METNKQFTITIQRVLKEDYQMTLEAEDAMQAFDEARRLVAIRHKSDDNNKYSVIKVEEKQ